DGPFLGWLGGAGGQLNQGAVGGGGVGEVEAQSGLDSFDGAVGVDLPLLVGLAVAVPDDGFGSGCGALAVGVEASHAVAGVDGEFAGGGVGPGLVGSGVAVPDLQLGAGRGGVVVDVQAPV